MKLLIIDNYDSFTYNLVQRIGELDSSIDMHVARNDKITVDDAVAMNPTHLLLSPGPCTPTESGVCPQMIGRFRGSVPILGVCLGHQTIGYVSEMIVRRHDILMHGKTSLIRHDGRGVFRGLPNPFVATRYHSLIVDRDSLTGPFEISAWTDRGEIMGLRWTGADADRFPMEGVQFHPESFLTVAGPQLLANFLGLPVPATAGDDTAVPA